MSEHREQMSKRMSEWPSYLRHDTCLFQTIVQWGEERKEGRKEGSKCREFNIGSE